MSDVPFRPARKDDHGQVYDRADPRPYHGALASTGHRMPDCVAGVLAAAARYGKNVAGTISGGYIRADVILARPADEAARPPAGALTADWHDIFTEPADATDEETS